MASSLYYIYHPIVLLPTSQTIIYPNRKRTTDNLLLDNPGNHYEFNYSKTSIQSKKKIPFGQLPKNYHFHPSENKKKMKNKKKQKFSAVQADEKLAQIEKRQIS